MNINCQGFPLASLHSDYEMPDTVNIVRDVHLLLHSTRSAVLSIHYGSRPATKNTYPSFIRYKLMDKVADKNDVIKAPIGRERCSLTLAAVPPISTDLMKIPRSLRPTVNFLTLMPKLAKPVSPSATLNVNLSCSVCIVEALLSTLLRSTSSFTTTGALSASATEQMIGTEAWGWASLSDTGCWDWTRKTTLHYYVTTTTTSV